MIKDSIKHLQETNETYIQHLKIALKIGFTMILGGLQGILHAIIPGILKKSASNKIKKLFEIITNRR